MQNPNRTWRDPHRPHEQVNASNIILILRATWQRLWDICGESSDSLLKAVIAASEDKTRRVLAGAIDSNMGLKSEAESLTREREGLHIFAGRLSEHSNAWRLLVRHHGRLRGSTHPDVVWLITRLDGNAEHF